MKIYSAPLQGFTEALWRNVHHKTIGGISSYYTPFLRCDHNKIRNKDINDIEQKNNTVPSLVPQIIASTSEEMQPLIRLIRDNGYKRADINMGCSFILQAKQKRGAGILPYPQMVSAIMNEVKQNSDITFSVKMRLGWESKKEWQKLMPILNDTPLYNITLHPRIGVEQYKKDADLNEFENFYKESSHPVTYNGDIKTLSDIKTIEQRFPNLHAIMLGRGLLYNPTLALEYELDRELDNAEKCRLIQEMHEALSRAMMMRLSGQTQFLNKIKPYWEYLLPDMTKRDKKSILKSTTIEKYMANVNLALSQYR